MCDYNQESPYFAYSDTSDDIVWDGADKDATLYEELFEAVSTTHLSVTGSPSSGNSSPRISETRDWNERFQQLLERPTVSPEEAKERIALIERVMQEFAAAASPIAKIIIEEEDLKNDDRTIVAVRMGIAGGLKYLVNGIFFKFASKDVYSIYGSEARAAKSAAHEIKGLQALIECNIPNLHFPLQINVDYLGRRLSASTLLPIGSDTLIYGSADGGKSIVESSAEMKSIMRSISEKLHLKPHPVGAPENPVVVYTPADLEGHLGTDGRYYVIDSARLFPPQPPLKNDKGSILSKLLRRELVHANPVPLSPDAFTKFGKIGCDDHNEEVRTAYTRLIVEIIPRFAAELDARFGSLSAAETESQFSTNGMTCSHYIRDMVHKKGINIRYLGAVRGQVKSPLIRTILLLELISRVVKQDTNAGLRLIASSDMDQCKQLLIETFNQVFGTSAEASQLWSVMPDKIEAMFPLALSEQERQTDLRAELQDGFPGWDLLFELLKYQLSVSLPPRASRSSSGDYVPYDILSAFPLVDFQARVSLIDVARVLEKLQVGKGDGKAAMFQQELIAREKALSPMHSQVAFTLENYAEALAADGAFDLADQAFQRALAIRRQLSTAEGGALALADTLEKIFAFYCSMSRHTDALATVTEWASIVYIHCGTESARHVTCQQKLGWAQKNCGLYAEALDTLTKVRKDAETQISCRPILPDILVELARAYLHLGRFSPDLIQMQEKALQLCEEIWQPRHSRVGTVLNNMAIVLIWRGDYAAAEPICQRSIQVRREALGETHPYTAHSMACLAQLRYFQGNYAEAASLLRQAESFYSVRRPEPVAAARTNRARVLWRQHKHNEAIELAAAAFDALSSSHALQSSDQVATIMLDLGAMLAQRGSPDDLTKSMQLIERALAIREHLGQEHPSYLLSKKVQYETSLKLAGKPATNDVMDLTERINVSQLTLYVNYAV